MGNKLFNQDIAGQIFSNLGPILPVMRLLKTVPGTRDASDPSAGNSPTTRPYACRGILDSYRTSQINQTIVMQGDRIIMILGDSLPAGIVPEPNDGIDAEGSEFTVVAVERDPDAATYMCQVRG